MDVAHPLCRHSAGVTLVELLASCAVMLTVLALGLPALGSFVCLQDTVTATNAITTNLALARHAAVTSGQHVVLCPSSDGDHCLSGFDWSDGWLVFEDANRNREHEADETRLAVTARPAERVRILTSRGRRRIVYRHNGGSGGSNVTFRICNTSDVTRSRRVIVNSTGRARVERWNGGGKPPGCG
jgi:type IV fimbrial biogenesis protein FimT